MGSSKRGAWATAHASSRVCIRCRREIDESPLPHPEGAWRNGRRIEDRHVEEIATASTSVLRRKTSEIVSAAAIPFGDYLLLTRIKIDVDAGA